MNAAPIRIQATVLLPLAAACVGLALLHYVAPRYLFHQGFPLDDAWIHAVYARELARSGTLSYNPGLSATGETAPLWPGVLAIVHLLAGSVAAIVAGTKLLGFVLHAAACVLLGATLANLMPQRRVLALGAASLVGLHPVLITASVSGMEVPLAELVVAASFTATVRGNRGWLFLLGAASIGARPEVAVIAVLMPLLHWIEPHPRRGAVLAACSFAGAIVALAVLGVRNWLVSGFLLPATFHAKASNRLFNPVMQQRGFSELLGGIPLFESLLIVLGLCAVAIALLRDGRDDPSGRASGALYLSGISFCAVSFALVPPVDPPAFYHQRYVLPGIFPMIGAMPLLIDRVSRRIVPGAARLVGALVVVALAASLVAAMPPRARHLSNDAENIDDVQVAFGRALAEVPSTSVAWVVDAGASRFFGNAFVVDMIGLNTPELLGQNPQAYLDAHPPSYLDVFPGWSAIEGDPRVRMPARAFEAGTEYTVTSSASMRVHMLVTCAPPGLSGRFVVRGRSWAFRCS